MTSFDPMRVTDLHRAAMALAHRAHEEQGDDERRALFAQALEKEKEAAILLEHEKSIEPTRSILFRSAASLALSCKNYPEADSLIQRGLDGSPPPEIAEELRRLRDEVRLEYDDSLLTRETRLPVLRQGLSRPALRGELSLSRGLVLLAMAEPLDRAPLHLKEERERIVAACRRSRLKLEILDHATVSGVAERLRERRNFPTVFHFIGHGDLGRDEALVFETAEGLADPVGGEDLARLLAGARGLRLAFLNACHSGGAPVEEARTGVITKLIHKGVPAVLTMRSQIHDQTAILFSERFYASLAEGSPLDVATLEGRQAVLADGLIREEWQVPVLYQQAGSAPPVLMAPARRMHYARRFMAVVAIAALVLTCVAIWRWLSNPLALDESPSVDIACPKSGLVQAVDEVDGLGKDPTRSYYLFIQDQNFTCWLQAPVPLPLDNNGKWSTRVTFSGPPGTPFTIFAVSSRQPLHPDRFSQPGRYDCSIMLGETEREACPVTVAPAAD